MKALHTADWHVGKRIGRYDRLDEYREVIDEVASIADAEDVDLVLHSGDVFDRPVPPIEALDVAFRGLVALSNGGRRPVVVIAGNHDSPALFEALEAHVVTSATRLLLRVPAHINDPAFAQAVVAALDAIAPDVATAASATATRFRRISHHGAH